MEEELELMYVDVMNDLVTLCNSYDDPEKFLELKAKCHDKIVAIKEYKINKSKESLIVLTKNKELIDGFCDEIRKLFYANPNSVREFNEKFKTK